MQDPICGMKVNTAEALKLTKDGQNYYFCSEHCLKKFAKVKWYRNKTIIVAAVLVFVSALSSMVPVLVPLRVSLVMYLQRIWWAILVGLALGGVIDYFIPREYIAHFLARPKKSTIFYAVILGFFMSACSHGILAISIQLHKKGAANPAVVAFLLASPWANFPLTIMLLGFFGLKALYIIIGALIIALSTGFIFQELEAKGLIETNQHIRQPEAGFSLTQDLRQRLGTYRVSFGRLAQDIRGVFSGSISLANMVLWWILLGVGLASLSAAYIPEDIFRHYMGPTAFGLLVTLLLATVLEVCSEGTAPLAFEIYRQTQALGNAFVFLMAGVVTDYTEIGLLWHNVGRRVAIWLPIIAVPQIIILGILANVIW